MSAPMMIQSRSHEPFPIADMRQGLFQAKEPWLSPVNAFSVMNDASVFRARLRRRVGFIRFGACGVASASTYTKQYNSSVLGDNVLYTLDTNTTRFVPESITFTWNDPVNGNITAYVPKDSYSFQDYRGLNLWGFPVLDSVTDIQIGYVIQPFDRVTLGQQPAAAVVWWIEHTDYTGIDVATPNGSMVWSEDPELPIVGLSSFEDVSGVEFLVAMNTTRFFVYNVSEGWFEDLVGSDSFTGAATDLFWTWPIGDELVVTNGVDRVKKYDSAGGTLTNMGTTIGAGPAIINSAKLAVIYRNRLIYMNTVEDGTSTPRRARWSSAGGYETFAVQDFADAPTDMGALVTAGFIADRLMVGFEQGWMELVYTGDPKSLFEWEKRTSVFGSTARLGTISDGARLLSRTENGIDAIDPNQQYAADMAIPDLVVDKLNNGSAATGVTYGLRCLGLKQFWWSVVSPVAAASSADQILVAQYQEDNSLSWSIYKQPFNCFTEFRSESTQNWDNIDDVWNDFDTVWDAASNDSGFPITLCGNANGRIYRAGGGQDYIGEDPYTNPALAVDQTRAGPQSIPFEVTTERLSPYPGQKSHFGWVDFYAEAAIGVTLTVEFRGNTRDATYRSASFSIKGEGQGSKLYRRIRVNKTAMFHTITIRADGGGSFAIDGIIPWFRPAGRMREFN